jgi:non-ribosomal peptide synthetase component F/aryl carrier-like protein
MVERDRGLNMMPLFHTGGIVAVVLTSVAAGASTVCLSGFDTSQFFACLEAFRPTWYLAVPAMHQAILAHVEQHREIVRRCPLRFIRSGAAALPAAARAELENVFNSRVIEVWGMTEASGPVTCNPPPLRQRKTGSVGVPIGSEVAIMDETGNLLATGEVGEVVVRGANVMEGYDDDPEANEHAFTRGWFRSGDAGYLDTNGYLFLTGRLKDIINRGGENIAPQEVDDVLMAHPSVAQAVTFTVPHPTLGEDLAAAVVLHPNTSVTEGDIRQFSAMRLAAHKVPVQVFIVEKIPQGPMGKPLRHGLAEKLGLMAHDLVLHGASAEFAAPHTLMEETLTKIWAQVLGLDHVDLHDNFAHLGGDSIHVTRLISRVREVMHVDLSFLSFFEAPTVAGMARSIEAAIQTASNLPAPPLQPVPRREMPPLSYAQQRLWFLEQLETNRDVYNLPLGWRFTGALNTHALADSLNEIVRRHEILRTTFPSVDGYPVQAIAPASALPLRVIDFQGLLTSERDTAVQCLISEEGHRPFDLAHGPLIRISLLRLAPEDHILLLVLHHVIFDGWSAEIFWHELTSLYTAICTGQPASLPDLPIQYADFAVWQRQWFQGEMLSERLAYWQQQLGHHLPMLHLPTDHPRPPIQTFQGAQQTFALSMPVSTALKRLSRQAGATLFMTLLAAFKTLLSRYTGQTDLVVGTPVAGRTRVETESLLGFFVNMLVLRTHLDGDPRFRDLLQRVRKVALDAYDHQEIPFEKLVEVLQPERDLSHTPLVQAVITLQQGAQTPKELAGLSVYPVTTDCNTAKFDLTLSLHDTEQGLLGTLDYASDLFDAATVSRMLGHFHTLLEGIVASPEQRLSELPLLTAAERQQILVDWNDAPVDNVQETCIHLLFEAQVERIPGAVAVVCEAQQLTYSALNRRANQLAHHLRLLGVGPEVCVGLCVERSLEVIVGLLGILKAGGAYVPLDPTYPQERIAFMLADAQVAVLVTQWKLIAELPEHGAHVVCLDRDWERIARQSEENPCTGMVPANLAYVMYTSGSTGKPKGVMIEHRQIQAFLDGFEYVAPGGEPCHGTAVCPFGFDVSVWECFSMLCFGRTLHVVLPETLTDPERLVRYLVDHHITSAYVPPTLLPDVASQLELHPDHIALDRLLVGVEPIKQATLQRIRKSFHVSPHC